MKVLAATPVLIVIGFACQELNKRHPEVGGLAMYFLGVACAEVGSRLTGWRPAMLFGRKGGKP